MSTKHSLFAADLILCGSCGLIVIVRQGAGRSAQPLHGSHSGECGTTYEIKPVKIPAAIILSVDISARKFADNVACKIFGAMFSIGKFVTERFFWYNSAKLRAEMGNLSDFLLQILI